MLWLKFVLTEVIWLLIVQLNSKPVNPNNCQFLNYMYSLKEAIAAAVLAIVLLQTL